MTSYKIQHKRSHGRAPSRRGRKGWGFFCVKWSFKAEAMTVRNMMMNPRSRVVCLRFAWMRFGSWFPAVETGHLFEMGAVI